MGYDVEFIRVSAPCEMTFSAGADESKALLSRAKPFEDAEGVRSQLLDIEGCRPGPDDSIDYVGSGLSYARLTVKATAIHVENNCGSRDLLKVFNALAKSFPALLIVDLQSGQLHDAASFEKWWNRPL